MDLDSGFFGQAAKKDYLEKIAAFSTSLRDFKDKIQPTNQREKWSK